MSNVTNENSKDKLILIRSKKSPSEGFKVNYHLIRDTNVRKEIVNKLFSPEKK